MQEKYLEKKKKLYLAFVNLEKAFDRFPRDVVRWPMRKLGVDESLIKTVMAMYKNSNSSAKVNNTVGEKFISVTIPDVPEAFPFFILFRALLTLSMSICG